jgi:hypothetical protein
MRVILLAAFLFVFSIVFSQKAPDSKFGKISVEDIQQTKYVIDTNAAAVVLFDIGSTKIIGNDKGWFSLEFRRRIRIHILKKEAYDKATVEIPIYTSGNLEEKLSDLKASTFNLEGGKIIEAKLDKNAVFKERKNKNLGYQKFTFPSVKEGSVIEMEYKLTSDFLFNLQPWNFQGDIPCLWSECKVALPQFLLYVLIAQGDQQYFIKEQKDMTGNFSVRSSSDDGPYGTSNDKSINISCSVTEFRWVINNIPALKEEVYTSSIRNYVKRLEFQLSEYREPIIPEKVMTTWPDMAQKLLQREDFGLQLESDKNWLESVVTPIIQNYSTEVTKTKAIFNYVKNNFTCTDYNQLYTDHSLKDVFKSKNGTVAEINLLLTAMLRSAGISVDPVLLSTRDNGFAYTNYPLVSRFNYVICRTRLNNKDILLDASHPFLGFGKLDAACYNGSARIIDQSGTELKLNSDQIIEQNSVNIYLGNNKGKWSGNVEQISGDYESAAIRKQLKNSGQDNFFKEWAKKYDGEISIKYTAIDSLDNYEFPVKMKYEINFDLDTTAEIIYFNPVITGSFKQNPFKSAERFYPVEMPYKINDLYIMTMNIPGGYKLDELPKSVIFKMNDEGDAVFQYKINQTANALIIQTKLEINKTVFAASQYDQLRAFFNGVVAKQNEQIVFRKM